MNRILGLILFLLLSSISQASPKDSAYKQLYAEFVDGFYKGNGNFINNINSELKRLLNKNNLLALHARNEIKKSENLSDSMAAMRVAQKLVSDLIEKNYYDDFKDSIALYLPTMNYAVSEACPCIEVQYKNLNEHETFTPNKLTPCIAIIQADANYNTFMAQHFTGRPTAQIMEFGQLVSRHLFAKCEIMRMEFLENTASNVGFDWYNSVRRHLRFLPNQAIMLFERKSFDSLKIIFPNYRSFETELAKAVKLNTLGGFYWDLTTNEVQQNGTLKYVMLSKDSETKVYGNVNCRISANDESGTITNFTCSITSDLQKRKKDEAPQVEMRIGTLPDNE
jgi:hypothetical protein